MQSVAAGFTPRDVFITEGADIYKFIVQVPSRSFAHGRVPLLGPQLDYVRQSGHIWEQDDRNVRERPRLDG